MKNKTKFMDWLLKQVGVLMIEWHGGTLYFRGQRRGGWIYSDTGKCGYEDPTGKFHRWNGLVEDRKQLDLFD